MKIIRTAQWNDLPGPTDLPPGTTHRMIDENAGTGEDPDLHKQETYYEVTVDWGKLMDSHVDNGYDIGEVMDSINGIVELAMTATFDWELDPISGHSPSNIRVIAARISVGGSSIPVVEGDILYRLGEEFDELIIEDIKNNAGDMDLPQI